MNIVESQPTHQLANQLPQAPENGPQNGSCDREGVEEDAAQDNLPQQRSSKQEWGESTQVKRWGAGCSVYPHVSYKGFL